MANAIPASAAIAAVVFLVVAIACSVNAQQYAVAIYGISNVRCGGQPDFMYIDSYPKESNGCIPTAYDYRNAWLRTTTHDIPNGYYMVTNYGPTECNPNSTLIKYELRSCAPSCIACGVRDGCHGDQKVTCEYNPIIPIPPTP